MCDDDAAAQDSGRDGCSIDIRGKTANGHNGFGGPFVSPRPIGGAQLTNRPVVSRQHPGDWADLCGLGDQYGLAGK